MKRVTLKKSGYVFVDRWLETVMTTRIPDETQVAFVEIGKDRLTSIPEYVAYVPKFSFEWECHTATREWRLHG
jgi:hypothetical protein